jgi:[histone H3]-lysine4 N-trimethyltransferase ASH1L
MALYAGDRGIMTGDELTYDYNFDPFSQKNVQECRCGSSKCRGVLGPKPKDERKPKAEKESGSSAASKLAGAKRKIAEMVDEGSERWNKKPRIAVPRSAAAAFDKATAMGKRATAARSGGSTRSSPVRAAGRVALVKKPALRAIARRPSMLKRIVNGAKDKTTTKRTVSNSSASEALVPDQSERPLSRKDSVKVKAESIRRNVVRTVRRARGGSERTLRPVILEGAN